MTRLFSYCIPIDDGAAPNPFWGTCTLAICKPAIRRIAKAGDWIVGTGSVNSPIGDISGRVVYAMKVTEVMSLAQYDTHARRHLPGKIPSWFNKDPRRRLGDAIYDFSSNPPRIRRSVHGEKNRTRDLRGRNVLLSSHFYYFGDHPVPLPAALLPIIKQGSGHRSSANAPYIAPFLKWIASLGLEPNRLHGTPQYRLFRDQGELNV